VGLLSVVFAFAAKCLQDKIITNRGYFWVK
jgi:hypothetical protein